MIITNSWLTAQQTKNAFEAAELTDKNLVRILAWACDTGRIIASGFHRIHIGETNASADERKHLNEGRIWQLISRAFADGSNVIGHTSVITDADWTAGTISYRIERSATDARSPLEVQCWLDWFSGQFTWSFPLPGGDRIQETWDSVIFDRLGVEAFLADFQERSRKNIVPIHDISHWISAICKTENSKVAWGQFKHEHGPRSGQKKTFESLWKAAKGPRLRGRPRKS